MEVACINLTYYFNQNQSDLSDEELNDDLLQSDNEDEEDFRYAVPARRKRALTQLMGTVCDLWLQWVWLFRGYCGWGVHVTDSAGTHTLLWVDQMFEISVGLASSGLREFCWVQVIRQLSTGMLFPLSGRGLQRGTLNVCCSVMLLLLFSF